MTALRDIPTTQRAALLKLERAAQPVTLLYAVANALARRRFIEPVGLTHWQLSDDGRRFIDLMNDPSTTKQQILQAYASA